MLVVIPATPPVGSGLTRVLVSAAVSPLLKLCWSVSVGESCFCQLLAIEGRAIEEVGELGAIARVVDGELFCPRAALDFRREHRARTRPPLVRCRWLWAPSRRRTAGRG